MSKIISGSEKIHAALKKLKNESTARELEIIELVANVYETVRDKKDQAVEKVKDATYAVDDSVRSHPWHYIGGAAILGLIIGRFIRK